MGRVTADQVLGLCLLAGRLGNGVIDLTNRANLQIRGLDEADHDRALSQLVALGLLDETPEAEARRNILVTPFWEGNDPVQSLYADLVAHLEDLPDLPAKMGIALDTGQQPILQDASADFRYERTAEGGLILRLDGMARGRPVNEGTAVDALLEAASWFVGSGGAAARRMKRHLADHTPPPGWDIAAPAPPRTKPQPGNGPIGQCLGAAFGSVDADALAALVEDTQAPAIRLTPWRMFILEQRQSKTSYGFVTDPDSPLLRVHACPGAPACASAQGETRALATALAAQHDGSLHVSGCDKGCAYPRAVDTTLVGRDGAYDLVKQGHPWDAPVARGLSVREILSKAV
jgi:precorrin-3B synthase